MLFSKFLSAVAVASSLFLTAVSCGGVGGTISANHQTRQIFEACASDLEARGAKEGLSREAYTSLVENLSQGSLQGPFDRLPLRYAAIFNMHACFDGKACVGDQASISISTKEERQKTCSTLEKSLKQSIVLTHDEGMCEGTGNETTTTCDASDSVGRANDAKLGFTLVSK